MKTLQDITDKAHEEFLDKFTHKKLADKEGNRWVSTGAWRIKDFLSVKIKEAFVAGQEDQRNCICNDPFNSKKCHHNL